MRFALPVLFIVILLGLSGCSGIRQERNAPAALSAADEKKDSYAETTAPNALARQNIQPTQNVSLNEADSANVTSAALDRKIIRNGGLTIEVSTPLESQRRIFSIAESHGGFVVTSEMAQQTVTGDAKPQISVSLVVRVPSPQFDQALEEIRNVGTRVLQEKRTGQDVTEESIDLEARIKNQRALENQFLEIMKRAGKVEDALEVQRQLAEVRTEVEKLEGRKRFLENQASLSTINVILQTPTQIVNAVGLGYNVRSAFADGVNTATAIILFLIRALIALLPVLVLIVLPLALLAKFSVKVVRRRRSTEPVTASAASE